MDFRIHDGFLELSIHDGFSNSLWNPGFAMFFLDSQLIKLRLLSIRDVGKSVLQGTRKKTESKQLVLICSNDNFTLITSCSQESSKTVILLFLDFQRLRSHGTAFSA